MFHIHFHSKRQCLHEEASLTDFTCQIDQKNEQSSLVHRIKAVYVYKSPWWPVSPKTCVKRRVILEPVVFHGSTALGLTIGSCGPCAFVYAGSGGG